MLTSEHPNPRPQPSTWPLLAALGGGLLLMCFCLVWPDGTLDDWRAQVRATARTSWLLFMGVFLSAGMPESAVRCMPAWQVWLVRHRTAMSLCFLWSHGLHAIGIVMLAWLTTPEEWARLVPMASRWIGGAGYAAIGVWMLWRVRRKARGCRVPDGGARLALGLVWAVFWLACVKRAPQQALYALPALAMLAAVWWRWQVLRRTVAHGGALTRAA